MSNAALVEKRDSLAAVMDGDKVQKTLRAMLPAHIPPKRMVRLFLLAANRNPKILQCTQASILGALYDSAEVGLEPGGAMEHGYLIPYKGKCEFRVSYKGLVELARRAGIEVVSHCIHENDSFEIQLGDQPRLRHSPRLLDRGEVVAVYATAKWSHNGNRLDPEFLTMDDIHKARDSSEAWRYKGKDSAWGTHFEEMCKKTAIRRMAKRLPKSVELVRAFEVDAGMGNGAVDWDLPEADVVLDVEDESHSGVAGVIQTLSVEKGPDPSGPFTEDGGGKPPQPSGSTPATSAPVPSTKAALQAAIEQLAMKVHRDKREAFYLEYGGGFNEKTIAAGLPTKDQLTEIWTAMQEAVG